MLVLYLYAEQCHMEDDDDDDDDADTRLLVLTGQLIETNAVARCSINKSYFFINSSIVKVKDLQK